MLQEIIEHRSGKNGCHASQTWSCYCSMQTVNPVAGLTTVVLKERFTPHSIGTQRHCLSLFRGRSWAGSFASGSRGSGLA